MPLHFCIAETLWSTFTDLLFFAGSMIPSDCEAGRAVRDHNVLLTRDWMLVVPRRHAADCGGIGVNAVGYAGFMLVTAAQASDPEWQPMHTLAHCGFPLESTPRAELCTFGAAIV